MKRKAKQRIRGALLFNKLVRDAAPSFAGKKACNTIWMAHGIVEIFTTGSIGEQLMHSFVQRIVDEEGSLHIAKLVMLVA